MKFHLLLSGYVAGRLTPTATDYDATQIEIKFKETSFRKSQRVVSGRFYNRYRRQECAMLQSSDSNEDSLMSVWIAKALCLFRVTTRASENSSVRTDAKKEEFAFVRYFEVVPLVDNIDKKLHCIRLKWARLTNGDNDFRDETGGPSDAKATHQDSKREKASTTGSSMKWFDIVTLGCLRGVAHVVRGDCGIYGRGISLEMDDVPGKTSTFMLIGSTTFQATWSMSSKNLANIDLE